MDSQGPFSNSIVLRYLQNRMSFLRHQDSLSGPIHKSRKLYLAWNVTYVAIFNFFILPITVLYDELMSCLMGLNLVACPGLNLWSHDYIWVSFN